MNNRTVLSGSLKFINLGDLLQLLSTDNRTGVLRISIPNFKEPGIIFINQGNPVDAIAGEKNGTEAMYSLFGWIEGDFEFRLETFKRKRVIEQRMMAVVLDALRVLDEGGIEKYTSDSDNGSIELRETKPDGEAVIKGPSVEYSSVVDEDEYKDGSSIVVQGRHGNWLWVVLEGIVDVVKKTDNGEALVSRAGAGAFIGGISTLLQPENNRSASAIARGTVQLGVIDTQQLTSELSYIDPDLKRVVFSLDNRFRNISSRYVDIISGVDKIAGLPKNIKPMIRQGDDVQKGFIILQGKAYVVRKTDKGLVHLMTLEKDDYVGKIPFINIDHEPSFASIFASEDLKLAILDGDKLTEEYNKLPVTIKNIIEYTTVCISATTSKACV